MRQRVAAIVGPTAAGKTALAVDVAELLSAEIVSIDSMQLYRGMDIGTDKAGPELRERVPHHLLDVKDPSEDVTVAEFQQLARSAIDDISGRGRLPLLVGGSGLYFRAVVDDLKFPPTEPEVRARLAEESERVGAETLHARLAELDPAAAAKIDPPNARRTIRALEVIEITGRPFSANMAWDSYESIYNLTVVGLEVDRDALHGRIDSRVQRMLDEGLIEEAKALERNGMGRTARMALGYRQVLDDPDANPREMHAAIARATKRFARRQESWFKADPRIEWLSSGRQLSGEGDDEVVAGYDLEFLALRFR